MLQQLDMGKQQRQEETRENLGAIQKVRGAKSQPPNFEIPTTGVQTEVRGVK